GRIGACTSHRKQMTDLASFSRSGFFIAPGKAFEVSVPVQRYDLGPGPQSDVGTLFDPADQVTRHAGGQPGVAHQHMHVFSDSREEDRRLSGRIAPSDDDDLLVLAELPFQTGGAVVDTHAFELAEVRKR